LELALEKEDLARLSSVPGLGKKTAAKMILALKGKLVPVTESRSAPASPWHELETALVDMGYERRRAADALNEAAEKVDKNLAKKEKEEAVFRQAVLTLTRATQ
jgi:Holliday junction DNA helicase RuvA